MAIGKCVQDAVQKHSISDPGSFWHHHAQQVHWHKPYRKVLARGSKTLKDGSKHPHWSWFPNGQINTTYNAVDRHVQAGNGDALALVWDTPGSQANQSFTYSQLLEEVKVLAGVMQEYGISKGDVVLIYMPMIPSAVFAMLAAARLGAVHAVVFGGFAAASLSQRIASSKPKLIMTASCAIEGSKGPIAYRQFVEEAIELSSCKPEAIIIWQRDVLRWSPVKEDEGQKDWQSLIKSARNRGVMADCIPVNSQDGLYILYTSGTTGAPKGILREAGGHCVGLNLSIRYIFDVKGPGDVILTTSDIGWVVGHSYIVYGPLLAGATTILYEGKPIGTPDAGKFWRMIEEYKVTTLFTAPTALRAIKNADPQDQFFRQVGKRGGLRHLRALFLAGERSEPSIITSFQKLLDEFAGPNAKVIDHWWSSESGSPITGIALRPAIGRSHTDLDSHPTAVVKPGSAGKPMPGFDIRVVDDNGKELKAGEVGNLVLVVPLAPTAFTSLSGDEDRFYKGYLRRFDGAWLDTGDKGRIDEDGYVFVMGRSDDVINVAAHRFSTGNIEEVILSHPYISEAAVVGLPDKLKGHLPFAFVSLANSSQSADGAYPMLPETLSRELNNMVRTQIGAIASLGGIIQGPAIIPKTRSGKMLRRVLRDLLEAAAAGDFKRPVNLPPTIEDATVVDAAREKIWHYFEAKKLVGEVKSKL